MDLLKTALVYDVQSTLHNESRSIMKRPFVLVLVLGCLPLFACSGLSERDEEATGSVEQAVTSLPLTITPHVISPTGWGVFGTGNPGPDPSGCQRGTGSRTDCERFVISHSSI